MNNTKRTIKKIEEHERLATYFANESHKFEVPISDALSGLAEAHQQYADTLRKSVPSDSEAVNQD